MNDSGASWLLHCRKLRYLDLYQTGVGVPMYASLLMGLTDLTTVGRCDKFGQVLGEFCNRLCELRVLVRASSFECVDIKQSCVADCRVEFRRVESVGQSGL